MSHHRMPSVVILCLVGLLAGVLAQETQRRELTADAKKTIQTVSELEFDSGTVTAKNLDETYEKIKARLVQKGITVRLRKTTRREVPSGELKLGKVSLRDFMNIFDEWAGWGWIVYEDGSITYFDVQCACCWPKGGVGYHESQYQEGTPEAMRLWQIEQDAKSPSRPAASPSQQ